MTNDIKAPIHYPPLDLKRCTKEPLWCKKEITKRLILLLLEWTRSRALPFITHIQPGGPGPPRPPVIPPPSEAIFYIFSNTTDGNCGMRGEANWPAARDPAASEDCLTDQEFYSYAVNALRIFGTWYCSRSFFDFDLSSISSGLSIVSATLRFITDFTWNDTACLQQGTQAIPLTLNDYHAYTGNILGQKVVVAGDNFIDFNSDGISYLESVLGSTAKLCMRDYDFDYLDVDPATGGSHIETHFADAPNDDDKPMLTITTG